MRLYLLTWNLENKKCDCELDKLFVDDEKPDVYVIGLQEVAAEFGKEWQAKIGEKLQEKNYELVKCVYKPEKILGQCLMVFVKTSQLGLIKFDESKSIIEVERDHVRANIIRLSFGSKRLCFVSSHLPPHHEQLQKRIDSYNRIVAETVFADGSTIIKGNDFVFWMGDLNFRLDDVNNSEVVDAVRNNNYLHFLEKDQLKLTQKEGKAFVGFDESQIQFPPTYKFFEQSTEYTQKIAWTDRVLYMVGEGHSLKNVRYDWIPEYIISDHRPVKAVFDLQFCFADCFKGKTS